MGCDIHTRVEVRKRKPVTPRTEIPFMGTSIILPAGTKASAWEMVGEVFKNRYYRPEDPTRIDEDGYKWNSEYIEQPYQDRSYFLFGILAQVRWKPVPSFGNPKGLPEDISEEGREFMNSYNGDGHSHSYLTLQELINFKWEDVKDSDGVSGEIPEDLANNLKSLLTPEITPVDIRLLFFFDN